MTADDANSLLQQQLILAPRDHEHLSPRRPWSETHLNSFGGME